jgi:transcription elongation factor GreA
VTTATAASLFRDIGLMADGPLPLDRPVPARGPGLFVVELAAPLPTAPIDLSRVGKWLEHVPTLTVDSARPTSRAFAARLAAFWLPTQTVLYIGATTVSIHGRVAAMEKTGLGDRRPHSGGHWLKVLRLPASTRIWWAATSAVEEYEDAMLAAFESGVTAAERLVLPDRDVILPWANLRRPTGERKASGIASSLLVERPVAPPPPTTVKVVPDGDADGANGEPPAPRRRQTVPRSTSTATRASTTSRAATAARVASGASVGSSSSGSGGGGSAPVPTITAEGVARIQAELDQLINVKRPEVIGRIRAAKELGDLKENADYTSAREEQSFLEGRIQALEAQLRVAVVADAPRPGSRADLGSVLTVEVDGESVTYTLVGSAEADAAAGRLSIASPVGRALVGAVEGDEVIVTTPRGPIAYRVTALT